MVYDGGIENVMLPFPLRVLETEEEFIVVASLIRLIEKALLILNGVFSGCSLASEYYHV